MPKPTVRSQANGTDESKAIVRDFRPLLARLRRLERRYNPIHRDLHFYGVAKVDPQLFEELYRLAQDGLQTVRKHSVYFLGHDLYDDGMFWYELMLLIAAAAVGVMAKPSARISRALAGRLATVVTDVSEFTVLGGDMTLRNREALGNLLLAFPGKTLQARILGRVKRLNNPDVMRFVQNTVRIVDQRSMSDAC